MRHPLIGRPGDVGEFVDDLVTEVGRTAPPVTPEIAAQMRRELLRLGYDGIIVQDATDEGFDFVVALEASSVKVVQP
jgi:hypothetical protein